ncbi:MAG TPA: hypothetical protein VEB19_07330 [Gemmatimonadaceae bacterium]|nr:hypothetical protein [Gemmatimonadaceae bacterium]
MPLARVTLLCSILAISIGCSGGTEPGGGSITTSGTVAYGFTGLGPDSWNVTGAVPANDAEQRRGTWSAAHRDNSAAVVTVISTRPSSALNHHDQTLISIPSLTTGTHTVDITACDQINEDCPMIELFYGHQNTGVLFQNYCYVHSGSIAITSITDSRVMGTFSGTGRCYGSGGFDMGDFVVTNGTFDVGYLSAIPGWI